MALVIRQMKLGLNPRSATYYLGKLLNISGLMVTLFPELFQVIRQKKCINVPSTEKELIPVLVKTRTKWLSGYY